MYQFLTIVVILSYNENDFVLMLINYKHFVAVYTEEQEYREGFKNLICKDDF